MMTNDHQMKVRSGTITTAYLKNVHQKILLLIILLGVILLVAVYAITQGVYGIPIRDVLGVLTGNTGGASRIVIANIRLPRVVAAIICGWGLSLSGLYIQSLLKNPLGAPSTLGISQGAAFGAAAAIVIFGAEVFSVTV